MQTEPITMHRRGEPAAQMRDCPTARWSVTDVAALLDLPLPDLLFRAQEVHRQHFDPNQIQLSTLLSIKTGGCAENCGYCSQSARFPTAVENQPLLSQEEVVAAARAAQARGATRFC